MRVPLLQPSGCKLSGSTAASPSVPVPLKVPPAYPWRDLGGLCLPAVTPVMPVPHTGLPVPRGPHSPQVYCEAFPINLGRDAATRPWIPTPLADLVQIRKAADSGPDSPYFEQVSKQWAMHF